MARFCFYCGRELTIGEKCACRSAGGPASQAAEPETGHQSGKADQRHSQKAQPKARSARTHAAAQAKGPAGRPAYSAETGYGTHASYAGYTSAARNFHINWKSFTALGRQLGQYLVRPGDSTRDAALGNTRQPILVVLLLQGICGGFFLLTIIRQSLLQALLSLSISALPQTGSFLGSLFVFVQGFGISLAASLLVTLLYQLSLRFLFRTPFTFQRLLTALCPSFLFISVFLFAAMITLNASIFNSGMLLLVGAAAAAMLHMLAIRQMTGMDDNRVLTLVIFVLIIYTGILALLFNLSLPVLRILIDQSVVV
jgi:hypothetical protein